jgi:hypothetical protein
MTMNNTLSTLPERALQLAAQVGSGIKDAVPDKAIKWVETGAALGALKTGSRVATKLVRRNPAIAVAAAAGAGLLWYAARRRARQAEQAGNGAIEGKATRVEARRANGSARKTARTPRAPRRSKAADNA